MSKDVQLEAATTGFSQKAALRRIVPMSAAYKWLLLFVVVYCARPEDWIPGLHVIPLGKVTAVAALLAFVISIASGPYGLSFPRGTPYLLLLFVQMGLASVLSPIWRGGAAQQTLDFGKIVLIVLIMGFTVTTLARLRKLLFVQVTSVVVVTFVAVAKGQFDRYGRLQGLLNGPYSNSNDLALEIALAFPFCLVFFLGTRSPLRKAAWGLAMLIVTYGLVRTGSRGGLITMLVVAVICLWEFGVKGRRFGLILGGVVVGVGMLLLGGTVLKQRFEATFNPNATFTGAAAAYGSATGREDVLWKSLEVTAKHPLFGVGPGDFQVISGSWHSSHDVYTQLSSEAGLPALILFLIFFALSFSALRKVRRNENAPPEVLLVAAATRADLIAFAIAAFFFPAAYQFFSYFLMAYSTAVYQIEGYGT